MKLAANTWVAVIDGGRGIILTNTGNAVEPHLETRKVYNLDNPSSHEQGRDRPGRTQDSTGPHRSSVEVPDLHQRAEDRFVAGIAADLDAEFAAGSFEEIIIVAPPTALGAVRKAIGEKVAAHVIKEIAADYTHKPVPEILAAVLKALDK